MSLLFHLPDIGNCLDQVEINYEDSSSSTNRRIFNVMKDRVPKYDASVNSNALVRLPRRFSEDKCVSSSPFKLDAAEIYSSHSADDISSDGDFIDSQHGLSCNDEAAFKHVSTITDVCSSSNIPEVEIISLLEEQIPKYILRADHLTQFSGYENEDWFIGNPLLPPDENLDLSDEQISETLNYFVLCAERLSQMTKTYNDIDAVTRLLAEKERDLELAARIGQSLLDQKRELKLKNEQYEAELTLANDNVTQLRHDLSVKNGLLQIYTQDLEHSDADSAAGTPPDKKGVFVNWDCVNQKVRSLEDENRKLRDEAADLQSETIHLEEKENVLVGDCIRELTESNFQVRSLAEELTKKAEDNIRQQEEITNLLSQVVELQKKLRMTTAENEELETHVRAAEETEKELTEELIEMKDRYEELLEMLNEAREELKKHRKKNAPKIKTGYSGDRFHSNANSLASEIESCFSHDSDFGEDYSSDDRKSYSAKVFETVRKAKSRQRHSQGSPALRSSRTGHSNSSQYDSESVTTDDSCSSPYVVARANNLEDAFERLSLRRRTEREYQTSKQRRRIEESGLGLSSGESCISESFASSTGNGMFEAPAYGHYRRRSYQFPEKLQIIKPLEGSNTLQQWKRLATPNLASLFESRPGIQMKGEIVQSDGTSELHTLSDFEEDDDDENLFPGKAFVDTSTVNTYTTSTIMHPTDGRLQLTCSVPSSRISTTAALPRSICTSSDVRSSLETSTSGRPRECSQSSSKSPIIPVVANETERVGDILSNTLRLFGLGPYYKTVGGGGANTETCQVSVTRIGLGLLSTRSTPSNVFTRTMTSSGRDSANSSVPDDGRIMDDDDAGRQTNSGLTLKISSSSTSMNLDSPVDRSPTSTVGPTKRFGSMRKGGLL